MHRTRSRQPASPTQSVGSWLLLEPQQAHAPGLRSGQDDQDDRRFLQDQLQRFVDRRVVQTR